MPFNMNNVNSRIHSADTRAQPALVFLHYFGGSSQSWRFVVDHLEPSFKCISIDLPGFGSKPMLDEPSLKNYAIHVQAELEVLGIRHCILIGHSMGGKIALTCAIDGNFHTVIEGVILIAPSPPSFEAIEENKKKKMRRVADLKASEAGVEADTIMKLTPDAFEVAVQSPLMVADKARDWWLDDGTVESIAEQVSALNIPVKLVVSKDDPAIDWDMTQQETIPNLPTKTEIVELTGIGHLMPLENPELIANLIKNTRFINVI